MVERVEIGPHVLYRADCWDVLDMLEGVDAVVTDPPYGLSISRAAGKGIGLSKSFDSKTWDCEPVPHDLMMRVIGSIKYAAVFGGNYYSLPPSRCWLVWDKMLRGQTFADCELIWTNFPQSVKLIRYMWTGPFKENNEKTGDHPTQKPVGVMSWVIGHIPDEPRTILDPFMGSGTTGVACANAGIRFIGIEREHDYFETACKRIEYADSQLRLFV